jgi:hypothetical protein
MEEEPTPTRCTVICHTEECPLVEQVRTVYLYPNAAPPVWRVQCQPCGQMMTDVVPDA